MGLIKRIFRLRDKTPAELQAELYFNEIGEYNPFLLAKHLGIKFTYTKLPGTLVGLYSPDRHAIEVDEDTNHETQDDVFFELLMHYIEHPDTARSFTKDELKFAVNSRRRGLLWWL